MAPLALLGIPRDRIAVRLALTLNAVETSRKGASGEPECMSSTLALPAHAPGVTDVAIGALAGVLVLAAWLS
jgi:hypothetical protein